MLLQTLFESIATDEQIYVWRKNPSEISLFDTVEEVIAYAGAVCDESDVYFGVGLRQRSAYTTVTRLTAAVADVDDGHGKYSQDDLANHIALFPFKPSFLVSSGHGFHAYWLYKESADPDSGQAASRVFVSIIGSDAVHDPERILRIPGTKNHKECEDVKDVTLLLGDPTRRYAVADITALGKLPPKICHIIATADTKGFSSRSERDWVVLRSLVAAGVSEEGIRAIAEQRPCGDRWREDSFRLLDVDMKNAFSPSGEAIRRFSIVNDVWFYEGQRGSHQVSTFVFHPQRLLRSKEGGEDVFLGIVKANMQEWADVTMPRGAFSSQHALLKCLPSMHWQWFGSDYETKQLLPCLIGILSETDGTEAHGTYVIGRHENYWVTKTITLNASGVMRSSEAPFLYIDRSQRRATGVNTVPDTKYSFPKEDDYRELVREMSELLPKINIPEVIYPMMGWIAAAPLKPLFAAHGIRFPILNVFGTMGSGKLLPNTEPVLTPKGWVENGTLKVGDYVIGSKGEKTEVLGVYPQGKRPIVRVTFTDGTWARCSWDHLWTVQTPSEAFLYKDKWRTFSTRELVEEGLIDAAGNRKWRIPITEPVLYDPVELPIDPYLLGVLLGDGHLGRHLTLTTDEEIIDALGIQGKKFPHVSESIVEFSILDLKLRAALRKLDLLGCRSWEKHLPKIFLRGTPEERLALLQGLMDTDGHALVGKCGAEFSSSSANLVDAVVELTQSLGGIARGRRVAASTYTYKGEKRKGRWAERVNIKLPAHLNPFRLSRKRDAHVAPSKYLPVRQIVSVEEDGEEEATCIRVSAVDGLYLTRSFIVTHNTSTLVNVLMPMLGIPKATTNTANTTKFILRILLSQSNAIPVIFGEFRESTVDSVDFFSTLRMLYDTGMDSRGHQDQSTETYLLEAPVIVDGEDAFSDPALRQRAIIVNTHPDDIAEGTVSNFAFQRLLQLNRIDFAGHFIQHTLMETAASVAKRFDEAHAKTFRDFPDALPDRVRNNISVVTVGLEILSEFFHAHGGLALDVPQEVFQKQIDTVILRLKTGTSRTLVDDFVEDMISYLANDSNVRPPFLAYYDGDKNTLWFHLTTALGWWGKEQRTRGKSSLEAQALRAQLSERCRDRSSYALPETMITIPNGQKMNCFGLLIERCHENGMSVPTALSAKSLLPRGLMLGRGIVIKKSQIELSH